MPWKKSHNWAHGSAAGENAAVACTRFWTPDLDFPPGQPFLQSLLCWWIGTKLIWDTKHWHVHRRDTTSHCIGQLRLQSAQFTMHRRSRCVTHLNQSKSFIVYRWTAQSSHSLVRMLERPNSKDKEYFCRIPFLWRRKAASRVKRLCTGQSKASILLLPRIFQD